MSSLQQKYKCALVTGSSTGLGLALSKMLIEEGITVVGMSRKPEQPSLGSNYHPVSFDLSNVDKLPSQVETIFKEFPNIDIVINNAGFGILSRLEALNAEQVHKQYAVMLEAPTLITASAISHFQKQQTGCLMNISSMAVEVPIPLMPIYNAAKAALSALSDSLMLDASGDDARYSVIDVRPGDFKTKFADNMQGDAHWNGVNLRAILDKHHAEAPDVQSAIAPIRKALLEGKSRRLRVGTFFQTVMGCLGAHTLPSAISRQIIKSYYKK